MELTILGLQKGLCTFNTPFVFAGFFLPLAANALINACIQTYTQTFLHHTT